MGLKGVIEFTLDIPSHAMPITPYGPYSGLSTPRGGVLSVCSEICAVETGSVDHIELDAAFAFAFLGHPLQESALVGDPSMLFRRERDVRGRPSKQKNVR